MPSWMPQISRLCFPKYDVWDSFGNQFVRAEPHFLLAPQPGDFAAAYVREPQIQQAEVPNYFLPFCCPRTVAIREGDGELVFRSLDSDRRMHWFSTSECPIQWMCYSCYRTVNVSDFEGVADTWEFQFVYFSFAARGGAFRGLERPVSKNSTTLV